MFSYAGRIWKVGWQFITEIGKVKIQLGLFGMLIRRSSVRALSNHAF